MKAFLAKFAGSKIFGKVKIFGLIFLAIALLTMSVKYYKEKSDHLETSNILQETTESLESAQRTMLRMEKDREINEEVKDKLHTDINVAKEEMKTIRDRADNRVEEILKEEREKQKDVLAQCMADPENSGGLVHEESDNDVGSLVAGALIDGMWESYENSVRDKTDSSR